MMEKTAITISVNGPVVGAKNMTGFKVREMVMVGEKKLLGEVISLDGDTGTIQVYEETEGLKSGENVYSTGNPLSLTLGPGMIGNVFDGIQRPLEAIEKISGGFIAEGIGFLSLDKEKLWDVTILVSEDDYVESGEIYATVQETFSYSS